MEPRVCDGNGECLMQPDFGEYREDCKNPDVSCAHNCVPKKCPNLAVCGSIVPEWLLLCKRGKCVQCDMSFGKVLTFSTEDEECPICLDTKPSVQLLNCGHMVCVDCFKRCWNGPVEPPQPPFPYPELEDEFDEDPMSHPLNFDPRVIRWYRDMDAWEERRSAEYEREKSNRQCPLCRKAMLRFG
jgi:hypothetical protein